MVTENADGRDGEIFDVVKMDGEKWKKGRIV